MSSENPRKYISFIFKLSGSSCENCKKIIERELSDLSYVSMVEVDLEKQTVKVTGDFEGIPPKALAQDFSYMLAEHGFSLH